MSESLDDFFTVNVTATTDTQTRAGFGTALFACCDVPWTSGARVREYASLAEVATAGFNSSKPGYRMAQAAFSQNPRPRSVKIGRRTRAFTQVVRLTPAAPVDSGAAETYAAEVDGFVATFTTDATPTVAEVCTGLAAAINARLGQVIDAIYESGVTTTGEQAIRTFDGVIGGAVMPVPRRLSVILSDHGVWDASQITIYGTDPDGTAINEIFAVPNNGDALVNGGKYFRTVTQISVSPQSGTGGSFAVGVREEITADGTSGTHVECTSAVAGFLHSYALVTGNLSLHDLTTDPGLEADLNELLLEDPAFYGLALDSQGEAEIQAAAMWAESNRRLFVAQSADTDCGEVSATDDILSSAKDASLGYTSLWFYPAIGTAGSCLAAALLGNRLPVDPGSDTWAFKTLAGVTVRPPTTSQRSVVLAKNGNVYERKNGVSVTFPGKTSLGEWVDVTRGLDWLRARIQESLFALQTANGKIPFTDEGIRLVCAAIYGVLSAGVDVGLFSANPKPTVTAPRASAVSSASRSARDLPSVTFAAQLAGAIHTITVTGSAAV